MAAPEIADETAVNDRYAVTIPAAVRSRLDVQPGDRVRWTVDAAGELHIEVVRTRYRAFEDFEPADLGPTNAAADVDAVLADELDGGR